MTIFSLGGKCFKAWESSDDNNEFETMVQSMRDRGVDVEVLDDSGDDKHFCIH